ncbi:hypothetical protein PLICRDRAFT_533074 [Plicaturopsis crispa FD-325 SS-3]|nr:hypothetical protein PLICRDRAFT_533074 [Plicaturopsis crispa FD-325 SS-3]
MSAAYGLLVPLSAKEGEEDALADFLLGGYDLVQAEPDTAQWFAVKYPDVPNTFAIFDTFVAQSGRQAHLSGKLAEALMAKAPSLLSPAPQIDEVAVLASKVKSVVSKEKNAGLRVGLTVLLTAKPKQVEAVKDLLTVRTATVNIVTSELNKTPERASPRRGGTGHPGMVRRRISWD